MSFLNFAFVKFMLITITATLLVLFFKKYWFYRQWYIQNSTNTKYYEQLEQLVKYTNDIILICDEHLNILNCNDHATHTYGYTREELLKMSIYDLRTTQTIADLKSQLFQVDSENTKLYETVHRRSDGSTFPVEIKARLLTFEGKKIYHTISRDITDYKKTIEEMKKLSLATEQSPASIVITNLNGEIEYINPKFTELTGYSVDECLGENPRILNAGITPPEEFVKLWNTILKGKEWRGELCNKKKSGEIYTENAVISPITDEHGNVTHFIAVKEDITEKKIAHEQLVKAKEKAEESDKLKSAFLSNMSHEIRTPMNAIIGFTEILLRPDLPIEKKERFTALIKKRSLDLLQIIEDILDISRLEIGQMKVNLSEINISYLLKEFFDFYRSKALTSENVEHLELILTIDPDLRNKKIKTDSQRLKQVLSNLLDNAFKFTRTGTIEIGCNLNADRELLFYVKDTGIGISAENQQKIFDRFRQVEETLLSRQYGGTGLGLSIAKGIVILLDGSIWVESALGMGTTFFFTLPYHQTPVNEETVLTNASEYLIETKHKSILIVEDDSSSMEFLSEVLKETNLQVFKAYNAEDALRLFKINYSIDIVLSDIQLPDINGINLAKLFLDIRPDTIIIVQSAYTTPEILSKCMEAGCKDYISKPVSRDKLLGAINKNVFENVG